MADIPAQVAFDPAAPAAERFDAQAEMARAAMPTQSGLIPEDVIADIAHSLELVKAAKVIPFPGSRLTMPPAQGMQSVALDQMQVALQGQYYERPGALSPEMMRRMVDRTPVLSAVIWTRQRQVARFCSPSEDGGIGFAIRHVDSKHELAPEENESIRRLTRFMQHCGFEWNPRKRKALRRDAFPGFMGKLVRDSLTMDAAPIETEMKRDRKLGIDGLYALDGATIRLCLEGGFEGNADAMAVQVLNGTIATVYESDSLIYEPRNPRADVRYGGYGFSETEVLVETVTGFLNAMQLNAAGFSENSIPKGMLHLSGDYSDADLAAFKRYWSAMLRGAKNAFALPVMVSKDQEGKASYENFGVEFNEMYFSKWMTFLTSMICAIYGMAPDEINFESFTNGTSSLSGSDTVEKLAASKDKGLRPLLSYFEQLFTDFIITDFSDKYCFRWVGMDEKDSAREWEGKKLVLTVDELRAEQGYEAHPDKTLGGAPLNPSLIGIYQQAQNPQGQDFGGGDAPDYGDPDAEGGDQDQDGEDAGPDDAGGDDAGAGDQGAPDQPGPGDGPPEMGGSTAQGDFGKALPPIYTIGA